MARRPKPGWEDFHAELGEDGHVVFNGVINDPKFVRSIQKIARDRGITVEEAFGLMIETGARIQNQTTPIDGSTQRA
jgi:hypothetical protein